MHLGFVLRFGKLIDQEEVFLKKSLTLTFPPIHSLSHTAEFPEKVISAEGFSTA